MRVLGIDPGLTRCGVGVVEGEVGRPLRLVDVGVIRTSSSLPVPERLVSIERGIEAWLDEHRPDAVAVERVFARSDVSTVMGTAQASGLAMVAAARRGLPVALHTPSEVKAAVSGSGRADKAQVGLMVTRILRLDAPAQAGRRRRRARAGHHPHLARRRPGPPRRRARRCRKEPMRRDRLRARPGGRRDPVQRRPRGRGSRASSSCARPTRSPRCAPARPRRCRPAWSSARTR